MSGKKITIDLNADTKAFCKQIDNISMQVGKAKSDLTRIQGELKDAFKTDRLKKAQEIAQKALDKTNKRAEALKERLAAVKAGKIDSAEYDKLSKRMKKAEEDAKALKSGMTALKYIRLDQAAKNVEDFGKKFDELSKKAEKFSGPAKKLLDGFANLGKAAVSAGAEINKSAKQIGVSAEELQKMRYIALQTGTDMSSLTDGFGKVKDAMKGVSDENTADALKKLNIELSSFDGAEDAFYGIMNGLSNIGNEAERAAIAGAIFGDGLASDLMPALSMGAGTVNAFCEEFSSVGALSEEQVTRLSALNTTLETLKLKFENVKLQIGAALLPVMEVLAQFVGDVIIPKIQKLAEWFGNLSEGQLKFGLGALAAVAMAAPLLGTIGKISTAVSNFMRLIPKLSGAMSTISSHPLIAVIGVIALILMYLLATNEQLRESVMGLIGSLSEMLMPILEVVMDALQMVIEILMPIIDLIGGVLTLVLGVVSGLLSTIFDTFGMLMTLLTPLIEIALIPLQLALQALTIPLELIGVLIQAVMPLFTVFGKLISGVFGLIMKVINTVLGWVETAVNWVIDKINKIIDGINKLGGWLGINIKRIDSVSLKLDTKDVDDLMNQEVKVEEPEKNAFVYDAVKPQDYGDTSNYYNNSNTTNNTTQNVTVVIENYAAEPDFNDWVRKFNLALAEDM